MSMFTKLWHMSTDMFTMSITNDGPVAEPHSHWHEHKPLRDKHRTSPT